MKLGILGTGKIVQEALPMLCGLDFEKIYILGTERSASRAKMLCSSYHLDGCYFDYEEMLRTDLDVVYIALPNHLHFPFAKKALLHGRHVIAEKPIAVSARELRELTAVASQEHRFLLEAMSLHHAPAYQSLREHLPELGPIRLVSFQFCQYSSRYDAFKQGQITPAFDPACAGGALMDLNIYNLHAIIGLFGPPRTAQYFPNMERNIDTSGILLLDYGTFKAVGTAAKDCQAPAASLIQGEKGYIRIEQTMNKIDHYELCGSRGQPVLYDFQDGLYRLTYEFREFTRIIREQDFDRAQELAALSMEAMEILEMVKKNRAER